MRPEVIVIDGNVKVYTKYYEHAKKSKGYEYTYRRYVAEFEGQTYEATSSKSKSDAKSKLIEKLRVPIRDRRHGSLSTFTKERDDLGRLTAKAPFAQWAAMWCDVLDQKALSGDGSETHARTSRRLWDDHLRDAPIDENDPRSLGSIPLDEVKPTNVRYVLFVQGERLHFKKGAKKPSKYSPTQKRQWRAFISGVYTEANSRGINVMNPCGRHNAVPNDEKKSQDILSKEEMWDLWRSVQGNPVEMLIVALGLVFLRPGEIAGLAWADIGPDKLVVYGQARAGREEDKGKRGAVVTSRGAVRVPVGRAKTAKGTGRHIVLTPFLREAVAAAEKAGLKKHRHVVTDENGMMVTSGWISTRVPKLIQRAKLRRRNAYILKHTGCSHFLADGGSITELEQWSGVAAATLWRHYGHCVPTASAERMAAWNLIAEPIPKKEMAAA